MVISIVFRLMVVLLEVIGAASAVMYGGFLTLIPQTPV
jgi:hypothetical protein